MISFNFLTAFKKHLQTRFHDYIHFLAYQCLRSYRVINTTCLRNLAVSTDFPIYFLERVAITSVRASIFLHVVIIFFHWAKILITEIYINYYITKTFVNQSKFWQYAAYFRNRVFLIYLLVRLNWDQVFSLKLWFCRKFIFIWDLS